MHRLREKSGRCVGLVLVGALASACTPDPTETYVYAAYEGDAFPSRVSPIAYPTTGVAFVTDSYSDTISVIDFVTGKRLASRPIGRNPIDLDGPHHIVIDGEGAFLYSALSYPRLGGTGPHASHGASSLPGYVQKLSRTDLSIVGQVRVDNNPGDIVLSADGKRLVVSHYDLQRATDNPGDIETARANLAIIDPGTLTMGDSPRPTSIKTCIAPHAVVLDQPAGNHAYVACYGEDALAVVDLTNPDAPVERIKLGPGAVDSGPPAYGPYAAVMSPDGSTIAVASTESKTIHFFDVATKTFSTESVGFLGAPFFPHFSADGATLTVPTQSADALIVVDVATGSVVESRNFVGDECVKPHLVARGLVTGGVYVVCEGDHVAPGKVLQLDADLATVTSDEVGVYPDAFAIWGVK